MSKVTDIMLKAPDTNLGNQGSTKKANDAVCIHLIKVSGEWTSLSHEESLTSPKSVPLQSPKRSPLETSPFSFYGKNLRRSILAADKGNRKVLSDKRQSCPDISNIMPEISFDSKLKNEPVLTQFNKLKRKHSSSGGITSNRSSQKKLNKGLPVLSGNSKPRRLFLNRKSHNSSYRMSANRKISTSTKKPAHGNLVIDAVMGQKNAVPVHTTSSDYSENLAPDGGDGFLNVALSSPGFVEETGTDEKISIRPTNDHIDLINGSCRTIGSPCSLSLDDGKISNMDMITKKIHISRGRKRKKIHSKQSVLLSSDMVTSPVSKRSFTLCDESLRHTYQKLPVISDGIGIHVQGETKTESAKTGNSTFEVGISHMDNSSCTSSVLRLEESTAFQDDYTKEINSGMCNTDDVVSVSENVQVFASSTAAQGIEFTAASATNKLCVSRTVETPLCSPTKVSVGRLLENEEISFGGMTCFNVNRNVMDVGPAGVTGVIPPNLSQDNLRLSSTAAVFSNSEPESFQEKANFGEDISEEGECSASVSDDENTSEGNLLYERNLYQDLEGVPMVVLEKMSKAVLLKYYNIVVND